MHLTIEVMAEGLTNVRLQYIKDGRGTQINVGIG